MRESQIEKYLVKLVKKCGGEVRKVKWIARRGAPDRMVWVPWWKSPRFVELKAPGKKLEAHQLREHKRLRKMGIATGKLDSMAHVGAFVLQRGP
jgi:hypothetical protein